MWEVVHVAIRKYRTSGVSGDVAHARHGAMQLQPAPEDFVVLFGIDERLVNAPVAGKKERRK